MKTLFSKIRRGWPQTRKQTPCEIYDYWNYRDELSEVDGILLKQDKIIIPLSMRGTMLERIHESHMHGHREVQTTNKEHYVLAKSE
jgi:hypothetical protein